MLCSISTGKSGSNWLERLRSAKGFPAGNDLEHFLNHHDPNLSNSSDAKVSDSSTDNIDSKSNTDSTRLDEKPVLDRKQTMEVPRENGEQKWFGIMSNVLAELFNMGDSNDIQRINTRKSSRKQPNPKICVSSTPANGVGRDEGVSTSLPPSSGDNSLTEMNDTKQENIASVDVEDEKSHQDLSAFSRTEVTVIDTSCPSWKFEKMLFRKKNVWKVRDKKCKSMNYGGKKRKASPADQQVGEEKKSKLSVMLLGSCKEGKREECVVPSNEGYLHNDKREETCEETPDILSQFSKKRFPFSRSPRKSRKGGSSVILVKGIPTGKKNRAHLPRSCLKDPQYKA